MIDIDSIEIIVVKGERRIHLIKTFCSNNKSSTIEDKQYLVKTYSDFTTILEILDEAGDVLKDLEEGLSDTRDIISIRYITEIV